MTDTNQTNPPKSKGHRFQKGHKFGGGRPKNALNKKTMKQKAIEAFAGAGLKLAQKAGLNGKIDGFTNYIADLAIKNPSAAAALVTKLISMEEAAPAAISGYTTPLNIVTVLEGNQFSPGGPADRVLLPYDQCIESWAAYNGGQESWKAYLAGIEEHLTAKSFARISRVVAPDREKKLSLDASPSLRLVRDESTLEFAPPVETLDSQPEVEQDSGRQLLEAIEQLARQVEQLVDNK